MHAASQRQEGASADGTPGGNSNTRSLSTPGPKQPGRSLAGLCRSSSRVARPTITSPRHQPKQLSCSPWMLEAVPASPTARIQTQTSSISRARPTLYHSTPLCALPLGPAEGHHSALVCIWHNAPIRAGLSLSTVTLLWRGVRRTIFLTRISSSQLVDLAPPTSLPSGQSSTW